MDDKFIIVHCDHPIPWTSGAYFSFDAALEVADKCKNTLVVRVI